MKRRAERKEHPRAHEGLGIAQRVDAPHEIALRFRVPVRGRSAPRALNAAAMALARRSTSTGPSPAPAAGSVAMSASASSAAIEGSTVNSTSGSSSNVQRDRTISAPQLTHRSPLALIMGLVAPHL